MECGLVDGKLADVQYFLDVVICSHRICYTLVFVCFPSFPVVLLLKLLLVGGCESWEQAVAGPEKRPVMPDMMTITKLLLLSSYICNES